MEVVISIIIRRNFLKNYIFYLGARSFYVIDTDKKQLIEVEANSKDDLEK